MNNFGLVIIGAHSGVWLKSLFEEYQNQNILLVEPVPYNIALLKENTAKYKNISIETSAVSKKNQIKKFYYVKHDAVNKLGKHWASGIGSFDKQHILNHKNKRFAVSDLDIEEVDIQYLTFSDLIERYLISSIDLLQIDVEGAELNVIKSLDFKRYKPQLICIEIHNSKKMYDTNYDYLKSNNIYKYLINRKYKVVWKKKYSFIFERKNDKKN